MAGEHGYLLWLFLLLALAIYGYWLIRENRRLSREWRNTLSPSLAKWLTQFTWWRSIQLLVTLVSCVLVIAVYDWKLSDALQSKNQATVPLPDKTYYPPLVSAPVTPVAPIPDTSPPPPPVPAQSGNGIKELYNPEEQSNDNQSAMDTIKKRYEDMLVTYFFLKKCGKVQAADYHVIISALSQEMASVNAPGRLQNDILTAAQGSYKEMYEQVSCDGADIETLSSQYSAFIKALSTGFTVP